MVDTGITTTVNVKDVFPVLLCQDIPKLAVPLMLAQIQPAWHCCKSALGLVMMYFWFTDLRYISFYVIFYVIFN